MSQYLEFLKIAHQRYESQQNILWKVETHYTWLVYIIAGALALVWFNYPEIISNHDIVIMIIKYGSILGLILAITGYYVVRKEGEYLWENRHLYALTLIKIKKIKQLHPKGNWDQEEIGRNWEDVKKRANKSLLLLIVSPLVNIVWSIASIFTREVRLGDSKRLKIFKLTVRDAFQLTLLLAALLFILGIVFGPDIPIETVKKGLQ